ncbi:Lethal(2) giant larvae sro7 [Coemansia sp. RSA 988]|nr:Lethal(2) giant larvae sro7 [Coemansia sp. RSA 988]
MDSAAPELHMVEGRSLDPSAGATAVAYDPTQDITAVGRENGAIDVFSARHVTSSRMHSGQDSAIEHLIFVAGEVALAAINHKGQLLVFDLDTLAFCFAYSVPIAPTCVALFPGTSWLLVGTETGRVYFVDVVAGRKASFSVDCLVKHESPVAAVEPHPIESERFLIAYADGTCVVCDLGKASVSDRAMVLSRHRFDHPVALKQQLARGPGPDPLAMTIEPWLLNAGWSPTGEQFVAAYSNGVLCIFGTNSGIAPLVARTIQCSDILSSNSETVSAAATGMDRKMCNLQHVCWCTHEQLDHSFIVVTSGSTSSFQSYIHIFCTKTGDSIVKSSRDVTALECYELKVPLTGICTIPSVSPWRCGRDGVQSLAILTGRPTQVSVLEITASLRLCQSQKLLGELEWCSAPAELISLAEGRLNTALGKLLAATLDQCKPGGTDSAYAGSPDIETLSQTITQLFCSASSLGTISLWCIVNQRLQCCKSVELDIQCASRLLGIEGRILFMSLCSLSGLLTIGMDSGEALICMLTDDKQAPLAQSYTPLEKLREQASTYYTTEPPTGEAPSAKEESQPTRAPDSCSGARPYSTQVYSTEAEKQPSGLQRERSVSIADDNLVRRGSKRLSSTFGALFRRGSVAGDSSGRFKRADARTAAGLNGIQEASIGNAKADSSKYDNFDLGGLAPISAEAWKEQISRLNIEMSQMLYGLQFSLTEQQSIYREHQLDYLNTTMLADATPIPRPYIVPYLFVRFYKCAISGITSSLDGLVAITYEGGAFVLIDAVNQRTLLVDNINRAPGTTTSSRNVFCNMHIGAMDATKQVSTITYVAFAVENDRGRQQQVLLAGTSNGAIIRYFIHSNDSPPAIVARIPGEPIQYLHLEGLPSIETNSGTSEEGGLQLRQLLIAASASTISLYPWLDSEPAAAYVLPDDTARLVAVHAIHLASGWHGIAAIDSKADITFLSLPHLTKAEHFALSGDLKRFLFTARTALADDGQIIMLGANGRLLQAQITSKSATLLGDSSTGLGESYFDPEIVLPPLPARKSITSWLLGKVFDPRADIDKFLSGHFKDLLKDGGIRPGLRLRRGSNASGPVKPDAPSGGSCSRQDSKIEEIGRSVEAGQFGAMKDMAEMRGQQLDAVAEATESLNIQSQNFLKNIRAYNAKQKKRSNKHFGLF